MRCGCRQSKQDSPYRLPRLHATTILTNRDLTNRLWCVRLPESHNTSNTKRQKLIRRVTDHNLVTARMVKHDSIPRYTAHGLQRWKFFCWIGMKRSTFLPLVNPGRRAFKSPFLRFTQKLLNSPLSSSAHAFHPVKTPHKHSFSQTCSDCVKHNLPSIFGSFSQSAMNTFNSPSFSKRTTALRLSLTKTEEASRALWLSSEKMTNFAKPNVKTF